MGSGGWFKTIIRLKKSKKEKSKQAKGSSSTIKENGFKWRYHSRDESSNGNPGFLDLPVEDIAATRIQTAFRGYMARKTLRRMKKVVKFKALTEGHTVRKQASTTLSYLHSWSKIQAEIKARRIHMVTEGRIRQKKLENQLKLDAKLQELEEEWCGGSDTMEEILARIQQREEASVKRERAMAYAFSHQWRANSNLNHGRIAYEANWGWSWVERWIAARPWESRVPVKSISPKKVQSKQVSKVSKKTSPTARKLSFSVKPTLSNGKGAVKVKGPSKANPEKTAIDANAELVNLSPSKTEKTNTKQEEVVS
ncbi:IQ motif [Macleaya cordata]|uniref:IQ motif n=1 Tax=Macleaya cordata TaxID=56857 RepID=A0A200QVK1_MACCD|nr:IQ motif [Macleaya cordata]